MTTYNIYRDGTKVASGVKEKAYTDNDLTPNTRYEYQVSAENSAGESELSDALTVTTDYSEPTGVSVSPKTNNIDVGSTRKLEATVEPSTAKQTVTWSSSNDEVATVDNEGNVTAEGEGSAEITVTSTENDSSDVATINVSEPKDEE